MALVLLALVLVFHFSMWQRLIGRVASGQLTRLRGAARYGLLALLPLLGFVAAIMSRSAGARAPRGRSFWICVASIGRPSLSWFAACPPWRVCT
jgi:hypothetical protein